MPVTAVVVLGALATSACTNVIGLDGYRDAVLDAGNAEELGDAGWSVGPDPLGGATPEAGAQMVALAPSPSAGCARGATVMTESACTSITSFNTTGAVCVMFRISSVQGWNASNVSGRTATATGASSQGPVTPVNGNIPNQPGLSAGADGYVYFNFTAGSVLYGGMACW